jgi:hypothetical protein
MNLGWIGADLLADNLNDIYLKNVSIEEGLSQYNYYQSKNAWAVINRAELNMMFGRKPINLFFLFVRTFFLNLLVTRPFQFFFPSFFTMRYLTFLDFYFLNKKLVL